MKSWRGSATHFIKQLVSTKDKNRVGKANKWESEKKEGNAQISNK